MPKPKIIIITGPTASGKSELAVDIAKRFDGEIISADSRQIYRSLDIGTGKVKGKWDKKRGIFLYKKIPHHCIDIIPPQKQCSAAEFARLAQEKILEIHNLGKIPIIAGGTGFWIDALVYGAPFPEVSPNKTLRRTLAKKNTEELFSLLILLDPKRAETIDSHNPHRLIRAIEIAQAIGKSPHIKKQPAYNALWLGISTDPETLKLKIKKRLRARLREGMVKEAENLRKAGMPWKRFYELGLEYRFLANFLQKKITKKDMIENLEHAIWRYAKRQMTWFKRNRNIHWIKDKDEAILHVKQFLISAYLTDKPQSLLTPLEIFGC